MKFHLLREIKILGLFALLVVLSSCVDKREKYVIAVSQCSEDNWRDKLNNELKTAEYLNDSVTVLLASANDDSRMQIAQINKFVDEGVDLLIVAPNQLQTISPAVNRAYDAGIPVILIDRKIDSEKYTAFIGCDNYVVGQSMGRFIAQSLGGKGKIVEIRGLGGSSPAVERHKGFVDAIAAYPNVSIVGSVAGDWKEGSGAEAMKEILLQTKDFDFVFAHNDRMAHGAYTVASSEGLEYRYAGVDALLGEGMEYVRDGVLEASHLYPTRGDEVIALAMKILQGKPYKRDNYLYSSIITSENVGLSLLEAMDVERQKDNISVLHSRVDKYLADYRIQRIMLIILIFVLLVIVAVAIWTYRSYLEKRRLGEQLSKKNEELERLNQEVLELTRSRLAFFTNISHELRTPLTLIADPVEMLLESREITGTNRELLKMVQRNARSLQQLVSAILDFRKVQNGKMELKLRRFDLVASLRTWVGDFELTAQRKNIALHFDCEAYTQSEEVVADKEKLARIVFNLLSNALKYTPKGGDIFVVLADAGDGKFRVDVKDTGKGIKETELPMVFERFFQTKGAAGGTGIGLALVKSFVELHGGSVSVESEEGRGSNFAFVMPCAQEGNVIEDIAEDVAGQFIDESVVQYIDDGDKYQGKLQQIIGEDSDKPTVLIIDDNNDVRAYERTLLGSRYTVLEAVNGEEGYELACREVPDLVICDVMMPVMDGLEFCRRLKGHTATSHIPVIMLTAKNLDEHRIEGYEQGADSYITKPFSSKVLLVRVDNLLQSRANLKNLFAASSESESGLEGLDDLDKVFVARLREIIKENLSDSEFSVESIGPMIGLSRVQLYRKVKALTGSSVVDLIRKARLTKAKQLLESTGRNISEVAYEVGFSSPSYFSKCFKDEFGVKPGEI